MYMHVFNMCHKYQCCLLKVLSVYGQMVMSLFEHCKTNLFNFLDKYTDLYATKFGFVKVA